MLSFTCKCGSTRVLQVTAKCSDLCFINYNGIERSDYVPSGIGLGNDSDYVEIALCMECGQVQGKFPVSDTRVKSALRKV